MQVQPLERALGVPLFHRTTRSVNLDARGPVLASVARPVITELLEVAVALRDEAELQRGVVTVVAMPTFAYMLLPRLMCRYAELHPNVEIRLLDFDSSVALQMLQTGAADLAFLARTEDMGDLEFVPMFQDEFVVLIPLGSAMFNGRTVVPVEEVAVERLGRQKKPISASLSPKPQRGTDARAGGTDLQRVQLPGPGVPRVPAPADPARTCGERVWNHHPAAHSAGWHQPVQAGDRKAAAEADPGSGNRHDAQSVLLAGSPIVQGVSRLDSPCFR